MALQYYYVSAEVCKYTPNPKLTKKEKSNSYIPFILIPEYDQSNATYVTMKFENISSNTTLLLLSLD